MTWVNNLELVNIIISKFLTVNNTTFQDRVLEHQDKIILHVTCTGWGGTAMEPGVPRMSEIHEGTMKLLERGFPLDHLVLRITPIFPNTIGVKKVLEILELFKDTGISRVRYSFLNMYPETIQRMMRRFGKVPFRTFNAEESNLQMAYDAMHNFGYYDFESCCSKFDDCVGCISEKDLYILGYGDSSLFLGNRPLGCKCLQGKHELLKDSNCPGECIYCHWKWDSKKC